MGWARSCRSLGESIGLARGNARAHAAVAAPLPQLPLDDLQDLRHGTTSNQ